MRKLLLCLLCMILSSCSGYKLSTSNNPLDQFGISSLTVPMFINETPFANVSGPFTKEITKVLSKYGGLKVYSGKKAGTDGVLIGIITSEKKVTDVLQTTSEKYTTGELQDSIGDRSQFYIPYTSDYSLKLEIILIKDPSIADVRVATGEMRKLIKAHPRVIIKDTISLTGSFTRSINKNTSLDDGGIVNSTQNQAYFHKSIIDLSKTAASSFTEVILNAF